MFRILVCLLFIICSIGCTHVTMYNETFPPKSNDAQIEVFQTKAPDRDYIEIAHLEAKNINSIKNKARELGADAIIIVESTRKEGIILPSGNSHIYTQKQHIAAIAIKYK